MSAEASGTPLTSFPQVDVLGIPISAVDLDAVVRLFQLWIAGASRHYVCVRDAHGVVLAQANERLMAIHREAALNTPDGMPLVWLLRAHGHRSTDRVYGPDLLHKAFGAAQLRGARHFFYGGSEGSAAAVADTLARRYPGATIVGHHEPPWRDGGSREDDAVLERINRARPDIIWVGLSTPKQEFWMAGHRAALDAPIMVGIGAAFDLCSGRIRQAPRWIQRSGFEWLFRVWLEPRRLARRYAYVVPRFLLLLALDHGRRWLPLAMRRRAKHPPSGC